LTAAAMAASSPSYHGSRALDADAYERQLEEKVAEIARAFAPFVDASRARVARSEIVEFRSRVRFQVVRDVDGASRYAMWDRGAPTVMVDDFPMARRAIRDVMGRLLREASAVAALRDGLEATHFLCGVAEGKVLATLVYSTPINVDAWTLAARRLLATKFDDVSLELMGRCKGVVAKTGDDFVWEEYELGNGSVLTYKHTEGAFSNPNRTITIATMEFLRDAAKKKFSRRKMLLELYCGNANHTCALANLYERVVAVEVNPVLVDAARESLDMNSVSNVDIILSPSESVAKSLLRGKFKDAAGATIRVEDFDAVLVDPPRAGLDADTLALVSQIDHVLYVSCGPENLLANIRDGLDATHAVDDFIVLDHFPWTRHIEVAVSMRKR
jgi:tRNA (uracil-5-)-methyltransferase